MATWVYHGNWSEDVHKIILSDSVIALAWPELGDFGPIAHDKQALRDRVLATCPKIGPGAVTGFVSLLQRFTQDVTISDCILYSASTDRRIYLGSVTGDYRFDPLLLPAQPHLRSVRWLSSLPRTEFTQSEFRALCSPQVLYLARNPIFERSLRANGEAIR